MRAKHLEVAQGLFVYKWYAHPNPPPTYPDPFNTPLEAI